MVCSIDIFYTQLLCLKLQVSLENLVSAFDKFSEGNFFYLKSGMYGILNSLSRKDKR